MTLNTHDPWYGLPPQLAAYMQAKSSGAQPDFGGVGAYLWRTPNQGWTDYSMGGANTESGRPPPAPDSGYTMPTPNEAWARSMGFAGPLTTWQDVTHTDGGENGNGTYTSTDQVLSPEWNSFLKDNGLQLKLRSLPGMNQAQAAYVDANGNVVGDPQAANVDPDSTFGTVGSLLMGVMTGGAAAAGLGSMGGAIGSSMGLSGGVGTAIGNGLLNTGMQATAGGNVKDSLLHGVLGATGAYLGDQVGNPMTRMLGDGAPSIEPNFFAPNGPGSQGMFESNFGLGDFDYAPINSNDWSSYLQQPAWGGSMAPDGLTSAQLDLQSGNYGGGWTGEVPAGWSVPDIVNAGDSAGGFLGTLAKLWKGAQGATGGHAGSLLGGLLGGFGGLTSSGNKTETRVSKMDPRMDSLVYGAGGFLPSAQQWFNDNRNGNPLMKQGAQMQADFYNSPQYAQTFGGMRDLGMSLLGRPMAGNPFTQGQGSLFPSGGFPQPTWPSSPPPASMLAPQMPYRPPIQYPMQAPGRATIQPVPGRPYSY